MKSLNQFRKFFVLLGLAVLISSTQTLLAQDNGMVTVQSKASFDKTVESLRKMVGQNDMMVLAGITGGLIGTVGLEIIRHSGFLLGGMPGELPKLMGVLLVDRFAQGPSPLSNLAGWGYHFWNGTAFGIIYSLLIGKGRSWMGAIYGIIIGIGFMASPAALSLGVGLFGADFGWGFPVTVTLAHLLFGFLLGLVVQRKSVEGVMLSKQIKSLLTQ